MNRLKLLEITQKINWIASDIIFFCFQEFFNKFSWKQKDGKSKLHKQKYWENILKQYARESIFKGKE